MPIYEYRCDDCGRESEILVFASGAGDVVCPVCGSASMTKLMSATSSITGQQNEHRLPGPGDTGCCGSRPGEAQGCAGPGSCCGRA